eukprot:PhF_6_TR37537/c0_g1_i5/m.55577
MPSWSSSVHVPLNLVYICQLLLGVLLILMYIRPNDYSLQRYNTECPNTKYSNDEMESPPNTYRFMPVNPSDDRHKSDDNDDPVDVTLPPIPSTHQPLRYRYWTQVQASSIDRIASYSIIEDHMTKYCPPHLQQHDSVTANIMDFVASNSNNFTTQPFEIKVLNFGDGVGGGDRRAAGYQRVFVVVVLSSNTSRRICAGGAVLEASLQSATDMVDVDFYVEAAPGLYEFQPFFRRSGVYTLCVSLNALNPGFMFRWTVKNLKYGIKNRDPLWKSKTRLKENRGNPNIPGSPNYCLRQSYSGRMCFVQNTTLTATSETALERKLYSLRQGRLCTNSSHFFTAFRSGAWTQLTECDGNKCIGDLRDLDPLQPNKTSYWVYVSDVCTLRIFGRKDAWDAVIPAGEKSAWFLYWGVSTLEQPATNFIEYMLGLMILKAWRTDYFRVAKRFRPDHFVTRSFDVTRQSRFFNVSSSSLPTMRSTFLWGGCPMFTQPAPWACDKTIGLTHRSGMQAVFRTMDALPDVLLLDHFLWRYPMWSEGDFIVQLEDTLLWLEQETHKACQRIVAKQNEGKTISSRSSSRIRTPVLIWVGPVRRLYGDYESSVCYSDDDMAFRRKLSWRVERYFHNYTSQYKKRTRTNTDSVCRPEAPFRDVVFLGRHELTSPLHYGEQWGGGA